MRVGGVVGGRRGKRPRSMRRVEPRQAKLKSYDGVGLGLVDQA